jgi:glycolate oxidase
MKKGLNCNVIGAGANTSALPLVGGGGDGHFGQSVSFGDRNLLAVEWVTPEGEVVRLGSLGSLDEWFCGDGPGPSLRGIIRGQVQPNGGMGVFTKAAQKLYHWPGPSTMPVEGVSPDYTLSEMPPNFLVRYFSFPSVEEQIEAERKIGESEIAFEAMGFHVGLLATNISSCNEETVKNYRRLRALVQGPGFLIIIAGDSPEDFEYKKRVLEQIITETKGKSLEPIEDPRISGGLLWRCIRITGSIRETFRAGGLFHNVGLGFGQRDIHLRYMAQVAKKKEALIDKGLIVDDSPYPFGWSLEHGHIGHTELFCQLVPAPESLEAVSELARESDMMAFNGNIAVPPRILMDIIGPRVCNYHLWIEKVKKAFDPNGLAESRGLL